MLKLKVLRHDISDTLKDAGIDEPQQEAKWLIKAVLGIGEAAFLDAEYELPQAQVKELEAAAQKRAAGIPLSKIVGRKGFWKYDFLTSFDVLDPRPDTEVLIEQVLAYTDSDRGRDYPYRILDLGTGSGCIILTLLSELPNATGVSVDISADALDMARQNAKNLGVTDDKVSFIQGDWLTPFEAMNAESRPYFDIIVSNPPYIPSNDIESLQVEVKCYDPILALDGGNDGMEAYNKIVKNLNLVSHPHSRIFLEIGTNQTQQISRIVTNYGFAIANITKDLGGINRVVSMALGASGKKIKKALD